MAIPQASYCLLCEDFRQEKYNKLTLLGFYGIMPDAAIHVQLWGHPLERLMFLLGVKGDQGTYTLDANILNPDGTLLIKCATASLPIEDASSVYFAGFVINRPIFQQKGRQAFQVLFEGKEIYRSTFTADVGPPSLFE